MKVFRHFVALLAFVAMPALSAPQYVLAPQPQPIKEAKVEVVEFFWYGCNHCDELDPKLAAWTKKRSDIVFKRVHAPLAPDWVAMTKTFYALLQTKQFSEPLHGKIFDAIHRQGVPLYDGSTVLFDWIAKQGIDRKKFEAAYNSFGVQLKVKQAGQLASTYQLTGVPAIVVDGKYITSSRYAGNDLLRVLDQLVDKAKAERKKTP